MNIFFVKSLYTFLFERRRLFRLTPLLLDLGVEVSVGGCTLEVRTNVIGLLVKIGGSADCLRPLASSFSMVATLAFTLLPDPCEVHAVLNES